VNSDEIFRVDSLGFKQAFERLLNIQKEPFFVHIHVYFHKVLGNLKAALGGIVELCDLFTRCELILELKSG
jgi:hypothetical protein